MDYENSFDRLEQESLFDESDPYFFRMEGNVPKDPERITHCFFTGHRSLPEEQKAALLVRMKSTVSYLYAAGVKTFHAGGALGFDMFAAAQIVDLRRSHPDMRLVLNLPFHNQTDRWNADAKRFYTFFLEQADEVQYAYEGEITDAGNARKYLLLRDRLMVQAAHYGIAYFSGARGGTSYTMAFAEKNGCELYNLYEA